MASYYFKYNDVDLTNMVKVRTVNTTVLPPRENNAIEIWERPGSIYNDYRYGNREITITFLVMVNDPSIISSRLATIANVFKAPEPKPLYLGSSSKFIYAVPEGDFRLTELRYDCYECEVMFVCHDPSYYSSSASSYSNYYSNNARAISNSANTFDVYNGGNASTYPIINIGVNKDNTSFIQIENLTNGKKLLLGSHPSSGKETVGAISTILDDNIINSLGKVSGDWNGSNGLVDSDRAFTGTLKATHMKNGVTLSTLSNDTGSWKGASAKRDLGTALTDFSVQARVNFTSSGINSDPSIPYLVDDSETTIGGTKKTRYYVDAPSINVKNGTKTNSLIIGTLKKGDIVTATSINNGYVKITLDDRVGYCYEKDLKKYYSDSRVTQNMKNVVTTEQIELRSAPTTDNSSSLLATIPAGTALRIETQEYEGFYKLYISYNGKIGYIDISKVTEYEDVIVDYPEDEVIATSDYKTGICEIYGWSADGKKLFKLALMDDNEYYEFTKPFIQVGDNTILQDNNSVQTNKSNNSDQLTVNHDYLSDGSSENWNNFYGELGIQRKNGKWQAWVYKIKNGSTVKKLMFKEQAISGSPEDKLSSITIYMGTQTQGNVSSMSISNIKVKSFNSNNEDANIAKFNAGDQLRIDCYNNKAYLNNQLFHDIDIGSEFIGLESGNNSMKVTSDDSNVVVNIVFNERHL